MNYLPIGMAWTEAEYRAFDAMSYSLLSSVYREKEFALHKKFVANEATIFGLITESKLFGDYDENDYYIVPEIFKSESKLKGALDIIFNYLQPSVDGDTKKLVMYKQKIMDIFKSVEIDYFKNKEVEWKVDKLLREKESQKYWDAFLASIGKILTTDELVKSATEAKTTLATHPFTRGIFAQEFGNVEKHSQVKLTFTYNGHKMKCMLDWLIIDHDAKVIKPYDLKTGFDNADYFSKSYFYWRYDIQAYLYSGAVKELRDRIYPDYTVEEFKFVFISRGNVYRPLVYRNTEKMLLATQKGYERFGKYYKSVDELIADYQWYKADVNRVYPEEIYKQNGETFIDDKHVIIE